MPWEELPTEGGREQKNPLELELLQATVSNLKQEMLGNELWVFGSNKMLLTS